MKTLPTPPHLTPPPPLPAPPAWAAFTPGPEKPKHRSQPSLLWELGHFFTHCRRRPHSTAHHILALSACRCQILHKIMSWEPCFPLLPSPLTWV